MMNAAGRNETFIAHVRNNLSYQRSFISILPVVHIFVMPYEILMT